ncbi:hypothetical protein BaRGS_00017174 [Batillaria attramentaria]|uniref:Uncharacterized protein n=1 Tax=Batillaria attramentaria TaxID=370345 RepID=A0ABD0KWU9_9CAEN
MYNTTTPIGKEADSYQKVAFLIEQALRGCAWLHFTARLNGPISGHAPPVDTSAQKPCKGEVQLLTGSSSFDFITVWRAVYCRNT